MQQVDHYLRQAKSARDLARASDSEIVRAQFEQIATTWESLAKERLSLLQLKIDKLGGDAILNGSVVPIPLPSSSGADGQGW